MAGKRKINSEVDSESKKSKNEEWDFTFLCTLILYHDRFFFLVYDLTEETTARRDSMFSATLMGNKLWVWPPDLLNRLNTFYLWLVVPNALVVDH